MDNAFDDHASGSLPDEGVNYTPPFDFSDSLDCPELAVSLPFTQDDNPPSNDVPTAAPSKSRKKGAVKKVPVRTKNFSSVEDELLCSAYLNVGKDPIVGANQPLGGFWARVHKYFHDFKRSPSERTKSSLTHRWGIIQRDTSKFCGYYAKVERKNQSGSSEDDKLKEALQIYDGIHGSQFPYVHCWLLLRHEPKWTNWLAELEASAPPDPTDGMEGSNAEMPAAPERPMGRDRAKKQRSTSSESSSTACLEVLQKMSMDRTAHEERQAASSKVEGEALMDLAARKVSAIERKVQIQERMLELREEEEINKVMLLDIDKLPPWVRDYYVNKQKKIAGKAISGEGSTGQ